MQQINGIWLPTVTEDSILGFFGEYRFLSNFHPCNVLVGGQTFRSTEHAYMAMKVISGEERLKIASFEKANKAKQYGQTVPLRDNWEDIKVAMMFRVCHAKFSQNQILKQLLFDTGNKYLEETNYWNDRTWGVCNGEGQNLLGKVLMAVRDELRI